MKTISLSQTLLLLLPLVLTACVSQASAPAVVTVVVTATPNPALAQSTSAASQPTNQVIPAATNTLVVQNQNSTPRPTGAPPAGGQPTPQASSSGAPPTTAPSASVECPTKNFVDVSTYKPKSGWPAPKLKVTCSGGTMTIETNGMPNFDIIIKPTTEADYRWTLSLNPQRASKTTDLALGAVGVAVNGVPIYGPFEAPQDGTGDPILDKLLEVCNGHAVPFHFHARPDCLFRTVVNQASLIVGYAFDGFPIMAPYACEDMTCTKIKKVKSSWQVINSSAKNVWEHYSYSADSGDLDKCNGMTGVDGKYRYYATDTFPYTIACFTGTSTVSASPGDGGQQGGPQPGGGQQPGGGPQPRPSGNPPPRP